MSALCGCGFEDWWVVLCGGGAVWVGEAGGCPMG